MCCDVSGAQSCETLPLSFTASAMWVRYLRAARQALAAGRAEIRMKTGRCCLWDGKEALQNYTAVLIQYSITQNCSAML